MRVADRDAAGRSSAPDVQTVAGGVGKWQAVRLVRALHRQLGLSERACRALEIIAMTTREEDWHDSGRGPICYRRKGAMAEELGVSGRQFYNLERQLERAGLIERQLTRNGWRGIAGGSAVGVSGLSLAPLVRCARELAASLREQKAEREARATLRVEIRVAWGQLARRLTDDAARLVLAANDLAPPRSEIFARWSREALMDRLAQLREALAALAPLQNPGEISDAPEAEFRCHTRNTKKLERVSCSANLPSPTADWAAEPSFKFAPVPPNALRRREEGGPAKRVAAALAVTVGLLRQIATPELDFYLHGLSCRSVAEAERAIIFRHRELGISAVAYDAARREMGIACAVLAVAIIDRNRSHPKTPVRNPGGVLRAMTYRHGHGTLDLVASVFAILCPRRGQPIKKWSRVGALQGGLTNAAIADPAPLPWPKPEIIDIERPIAIIDPVSRADDATLQNEMSDGSREAPRMRSCHPANTAERSMLAAANTHVSQPFQEGRERSLNIASHAL